MPSVLSIGAVDGDSAGNIVPDGEVTGTFRAMNEEYRAKSHQKIREICQIANEMGGICEVDIKIGYPFLKMMKN